MPNTSYLSVVKYKPGHAGLKSMVEKTVDAYKKHDPNRHFFIYKPVDGTPGIAYCVVSDGQFGLLTKEVGKSVAQTILNDAKDGITSKKNYTTNLVRHSRGFHLGAPYLAVIKVTYNPANAVKIREIAKKAESHEGAANKHTVFTMQGEKNTFYIAFGLDNINVLDKKGGLMSYVEDPSLQALYNEFKDSVEEMKLLKLRLLPEFSNC